MSALRRRQFGGILRLELRKLLLGRRAIPLYLFAALPLGLCTMFVLVSLVFEPPDDFRTPAQASVMFAYVYQFILRGMIYLGAVWIFMNLFRGEVLDRSLHYYFLAPVRRELLVAGKFVSGWLATTALFVGSTLASLGVLVGYFGLPAAADFLLRGPGLGQWLAYAGVTALGCLGYGAVFLLAGLFFRNPILPAVVILFWEGINAFLPSLLKKISVIFYLQSMLPIKPSEGPFALLADPVPVWVAVPGLVVFSLAALAAAGLRIRRMEIAYGTD